MKTKVITLAALALLTVACQKEDQSNFQAPSFNSSGDIRELSVPKSFDFSTSREITASITVRGLNDQPLGGKKVSFFAGDPDEGAALIGVGVTNPAGMLDMPVEVPAYVEDITVLVHATGFNHRMLVSSQGNIQLDFGGKPAARNLSVGKTAASQKLTPISGNYFYIGDFTTGKYEGLPKYLENPGDVLSQAFLDDVNASLPERVSIPNTNPGYMTTGNELDVVITDSSDVWVTFVSEGASYQNTLAYYVFDTDNPPATEKDIDSIFVVLPNTSFNGAGGKHNAGDKVKLGTFAGGQTISWVLIQKGWVGTGVDVNKTKFYSRIDFNTAESDVTKRQHTVQLLDLGRQLLLNSFEDQTRSNNGSDNDFNDLVFYVTANPWENVNTGGIPPITPKDDCDNDGVSDESDDFPCDASRAIRNTFTGTLAYEDLWPAQGDYDFNDMVIDYEIDHILNGANLLVEVEADWTVRAVGAGFHNGFGWSFDGVNPNIISSVSGQDLSGGLITNASNGTESGQTDAVIIAFDDVFNVMPNPGTKFINTIPGETTVAPQTVSNKVTFTSPQQQANIGLPPYNAFIFTNATRGNEVHLANKMPSDLADNSRFGTEADATDVNAGYTYKTANGLPWAIHISESFDYPIEYTPINEAYLNFSSWATSGGAVNLDWFTDAIGNRDQSKIYQ
ncbi:MAG: LruC domain-containing protein [Bacteroidetes bacterium]|nr:LruC domain-containing protein [Bacteroidota bacterium]